MQQQMAGVSSVSTILSRLYVQTCTLEEAVQSLTELSSVYLPGDTEFFRRTCHFTLVGCDKKEALVRNWRQLPTSDPPKTRLNSVGGRGGNPFAVLEKVLQSARKVSISANPV